MTDAPMFERLALIGVGLIGSSIARAARRQGLVREIVATARSAATAPLWPTGMQTMTRSAPSTAAALVSAT